jgi:tetraacyldisaccharide 4'-kinase
MILESVEGAWAGLLAARARRYAQGRWQSARLSRPTISVGNLTMGGTGKTPVVAFLAAKLAERGLRPAILSRGYGRRSRRPLLVSRGSGPLVGPAEGGDEPVELAAQLPGVVIAVARRRAEAARLAEQVGAGVFLLDDGFQHLAVRRDLDLLLLDAKDPFGGRRFPPRGRLREGVSAISRADAIVFTRADQPVQAGALETVARWNPGAPIFHARIRASGVFDEAGSPADPAGPALGVCGVARPGTFLASLAGAGVTVSGLLVFRDHHRYGNRDISQIRRAARRAGASWIATSGKDAVKLRGRVGLPLAELRLDVEVEEPGFWPLVMSRVGSGPPGSPEPQ